MATVFIVLLIIILLSKQLENSVKIPSILTILILAYLLSQFYPGLINVTPDDFDELLYLMLPVILMPDILNLSLEELKRHYKAILYLAVIAVAANIAVATFLAPLGWLGHEIDPFVYIALFTILMATDAITVSSAMTHFVLPERLKIYAETESIFNDVTALVFFFFIAYPMISGGTFTTLSLSTLLPKILLLSVAIGVIISYMAYWLLKLIKEPIEQFIIIYLMVVTSFSIAEHFHIAGILAIVATVIGFKYFIGRESSEPDAPIADDNLYERIRMLLKKVPALTRRELREYRKEAAFIGIFANAVIFIVLAHLFDLNLLWDYRYEIGLVFLLITFMRFLTVLLFVRLFSLPTYWSGALTYSGMKGALGIIMLHALPSDLPQLELIEAVVIGNIILSMFLYTPMLTLHIIRHRDAYANDTLLGSTQSDAPNITGHISTILQQEAHTGALTPLFMTPLLEQEMERCRRYKQDLSLILVDIGSHDPKILSIFGSIVRQKIRTTDIFATPGKGRYLIITPNTSLSGAVMLSEHIDRRLRERLGTTVEASFGITLFSETDDKELLFEKLEDALMKAKQERGLKIESE